MNKKPEKKVADKKVIEKQVFDNKSFKNSLGLSTQNVKEKDLSWIPFNKAYFDAVGLPGVPRGYTSQFRGFSDVGKSTSIYETIVGAQKLGDYVVIIDTEGSFNWAHAKNIGMDFETVPNEDGELTYVGEDFVFFSGPDLLNMFECFDYDKAEQKKTPLRYIPVIEDVARIMNTLLDRQAKGELNKNLTFLWDSIGSVSCYKSAISNSNNNMWNAGALNRAFESILNFRIPASRRVTSPFINTFVTVQKIWLQPNAVGQPTIMNKGGDGFKYGVRMVMHMGGKSTASSVKLKATNAGREFQFGVQTKIECVKNHVNGIELKGSICSTNHGFVNPDELDAYKKEHKDFINEKLGTNFEDFTVVTEGDLDKD